MACGGNKKREQKEQHEQLSMKIFLFCKRGKYNLNFEKEWFDIPKGQRQRVVNSLKDHIRLHGRKGDHTPNLQGEAQPLRPSSLFYTMFCEWSVTPHLWRRGGHTPKWKLIAKPDHCTSKSQHPTMISKWGVTPPLSNEQRVWPPLFLWEGGVTHHSEIIVWV